MRTKRNVKNQDNHSTVTTRFTVVGKENGHLQYWSERHGPDMVYDGREFNRLFAPPLITTNEGNSHGNETDSK